MRYGNIPETIGDTPIVSLNRLAPAGVNVYVKVESFNQGGSVQDHMARAVLEEAELGRAGVEIKAKAGVDPYSLLPDWLQPRKRA